MIHYLSTPTLSWDAILNMTKVELELISDVRMYLFFEKSMRTRVSYISKRHSKANNQYLKSYDPKQESKHIYSDTYNTYGYAMCKFFQLCELHNDYLLSPDIKQIKKEMLSNYQLKIAGFCNIPIDNVKKFVSNFLINKSMSFIMKTCNFI